MQYITQNFTLYIIIVCFNFCLNMAAPNKGIEAQNATAPPPYDFVTPNNFHNIKNQPVPNFPIINLQQSTPLKLWKVMKALVIVELILGIISFAFGAACTGYSASILTYRGVCIDSSGIWVGILCIITAGLGIGALSIPTGHRCMLVAHFVLLIISSVGCGILIIFSSIWIDQCRYISQLYPPYQAMLTFNVVLLIVSLALCK